MVAFFILWYGFYNMVNLNKAELHAVSAVCAGIPDPATRRALIIAHEGFTLLEDLGVLETGRIITEMATRMASRSTQSAGFTAATMNEVRDQQE
jgi:hypothetical protein